MIPWKSRSRLACAVCTASPPIQHSSDIQPTSDLSKTSHQVANAEKFEGQVRSLPAIEICKRSLRWQKIAKPCLTLAHILNMILIQSEQKYALIKFLEKCENTTSAPEWDKMWSLLAVQKCHFLLIARNPHFRNRKCRIWYYKVSRQKVTYFENLNI